jgi:hypothetical protein
LVAVIATEVLTVVAVATIGGAVGVLSIAATVVGVSAATTVVGVELPAVGVSAVPPQAASNPITIIMTRATETFCPGLCFDAMYFLL